MRLRNVLRPGLDRETRRDVARVSLQTLIATGATYALMTALEWPHVSWGVISAIFVIQLNSDTSIISGLGRIAGTVLGTAFGLGAFYLIEGEWAVLLRVAITTALASGIATIWPKLRYGAVAAAAIAVQQYPELIEAVQQAVAISLGAVVGTAATVLVWPELGRNRVLRMLEYGLRDCRELLTRILSEEGELNKEKRRAIHDNFIRHMATARSVLHDSHIKVHLANGQPLGDVVGAVDRLWYALVLLDRAIGHEHIDLQQEDRKFLQGHAEGVQHEARSFLEKMVAYLQKGEPFPRLDSLQDALEEAREAAEERLRKSQESPKHGRTIRVLLFALEEVSDNLVDLQALAKEPQDDREA